MRWTALALALAVGSMAAEARADLPPPNRCDTEGAACPNGGSDEKTAGACLKTTCSQMNKASMKIEQYECLKCVEGATPTAKKSKGCATVPGTDAGGHAGVLVLAMAVLGLGRRARLR